MESPMSNQIYSPRSPIIAPRSSLMQPFGDRLLTEDGSYFITEDGAYFTLEGDGHLFLAVHQ